MKKFFNEVLNPSKEQSESFVLNIWGPIINLYLHNLWFKILSINKKNTKFLFCFRSGLCIFDLLDTYLKAKSIDLDDIIDYDFLKISRIIAIKSLFVKNYEDFVKFLKYIYPYKSIPEIYYYLTASPYNGDSKKSIEEVFKDDVEAKDKLTYECLLFKENI